MQMVKSILKDPALRFGLYSLEGCRLQIEPMRRTDLSEVLAIEQSSFTHPWSQAAFEAEMKKPNSNIEVARLTEGDRVQPVLGYVCSWLVADEIQISNIAVHREYRQRGIGLHLLLHAIQLGYKAGARFAVLEVGCSNKPARALYERFGFVAFHKRARYYPESNEDALVMGLNLEQWWASRGDCSHEQ